MLIPTTQVSKSIPELDDVAGHVDGNAQRIIGRGDLEGDLNLPDATSS